MTKRELRARYKIKRQEHSAKALDDFSIAVANQLLKLDIWNHEFYHIFLPIEAQNEVNTEYILNILLGKDKNIVISKSDFKTLQMTHYLLTDSTRIKKNKYQIPEPIDGIVIASSTIDVVFVPLLAFDESGHRVGYGKGFYDKFLSECRKDSIKVGLSFFEAEASISDVFKEDVKLDFCVTPSKTFVF